MQIRKLKLNTTTCSCFKHIHVRKVITGKRKERGGAVAYYRHATSHWDTRTLQTQLCVITVARVLPHAALQPQRESVGHQNRLRSILSRQAPSGCTELPAVKFAWKLVQTEHRACSLLSSKAVLAPWGQPLSKTPRLCWWERVVNHAECGNIEKVRKCGVSKSLRLSELFCNLWVSHNLGLSVNVSESHGT